MISENAAFEITMLIRFSAKGIFPPQLKLETGTQRGTQIHVHRGSGGRGHLPEPSTTRTRSPVCSVNIKKNKRQKESPSLLCLGKPLLRVSVKGVAGLEPDMQGFPVLSAGRVVSTLLPGLPGFLESHTQGIRP